MGQARSSIREEGIAFDASEAGHSGETISLLLLVLLELLLFLPLIRLQ